MNNRKALFVDDNEQTIISMKRMLHKEKYEIFLATSAQLARDIMEREKIDVVVSDEKMPDVSGTAFLTSLKKLHPETIRILLTGHVDSEVALKAINEANVYRFLFKPCNGLDLLVTLREAIEYKIFLEKTERLLKTSIYQTHLVQKLISVQANVVERAAHDILKSLVWDDAHKESSVLLKEIDAALRKFTEVINLGPQDHPHTPLPWADRFPQSASPAKESPEATGPTAVENTTSPPLKETTDYAPAPVSASSAVSSGAEPLTDVLAGVQNVKDLKPLMTRSAIQEHLDNCKELKGMSPTVAQILKMTQSANCSLEQVVKVVKQDHAVSLKLLKLANSSAYTRGDPVDTVHKAVMRIGLTQIRQAVINISVIDQFSNADADAPFSAAQFWEHSIATGLICAEITHAISDKTAELDIAFTMGLLHDIGRMVYLEMLGDQYSAVLQAAQALQAPLEQVETRMLLINHADAMDRILHKWKFPQELVNPIALHQLSLGNIRRMAPNTMQEVAILALANRLAHALLLGSSGNLTLYPIEEFCEFLRLSPEVIQNIETKIPEQTDDIKFSLLAFSNQKAWPRLRDQLRDQLKYAFCPICVSDKPQFEVLRFFCDRLGHLEADESPNVACIHIRRGQECVPLTEKVRQAEKQAGVNYLPLMILSPAGDLRLEESFMADRCVELLPYPVTISRFIAAFNKIGELSQLTAMV